MTHEAHDAGRHAPLIAIRRTEARDLPDLGRLWNDGRVMGWVWYADGLGIDEAGLREWLEWIDASPDRHHFVIHEPSVGFCGELFYHLDPAGRAELDIKLVPEAQRRGIATAALTKLLDLVFREEPSAVLAWTEPSAANLRARALSSRCGLVPEPRPADLEGDYEFWAIRREAAGGR